MPPGPPPATAEAAPAAAPEARGGASNDCRAGCGGCRGGSHVLSAATASAAGATLPLCVPRVTCQFAVLRCYIQSMQAVGKHVPSAKPCFGADLLLKDVHVVYGAARRLANKASTTHKGLQKARRTLGPVHAAQFASGWSFRTNSQKNRNTLFYLPGCTRARSRPVLACSLQITGRVGRHVHNHR